MFFFVISIKISEKKKEKKENIYNIAFWCKKAHFGTFNALQFKIKHKSY